jgi:hypothetical protein
MLTKKIFLQIILLLFGLSLLGQNQIDFNNNTSSILSDGQPLTSSTITESVPLPPCIINTISAQTTGASSMTTDGKSFWVGSFPSQIVKVSQTGALLKTLNIGFTRPYGMEFIDGYLWVTDNSGFIHKIDTASGASVKSFPTVFASDETGLAWDGTYLWHLSRGTKTITKVDTATGLAADTLDVSFLSLPSGLTFQGPYLWVGENSSHEILRMDTATLAVLDTIDAPSIFPNGQAILGPYLWTIGNPFGSDSIYQIDLKCTLCGPNPVTNSISATACDSYTAPSGAFYTASGIYQDTLLTIDGCDSVLSINLTITNSTNNFIAPSACDSYVSPSGVILTSTGLYQDTLVNSIGCDSIISIDLTINSPSSGVVDASACDSYTSPSGSNIWTSSGTYQDTIVNVVGCDSVMTINLTIDTVDTGVSQNNATLTADEVGATYQWLDCENGFAVITNETNQTFIPTANGNYAVAITKGACVDTSACFAISTVGIYEQAFGANIQMYPNPTTGSLQIVLDKTFANLKVKVRTIEGKLIDNFEVDNQQNIELELTGAAGIYMVELEHQGGRMVAKVVKR